MGGGSEFKYDIFDILLLLLKMLQCTPSTIIKKEARLKSSEY
jgi:hypothetical protein